MEALRYVHHPSYRGIIFRRTFPRLQEIMDRSWKWYPETGAHWTGEERSWRWPNGAKLYMRHCEHEEDKRNYQGHEWQGLFFDQLEEFTSTQIEFLMAQLRSNVPELQPYVRSTFNPGGVSHAWVKERFIDHGTITCAPWRPTNDEGTELASRCFHFATLADNPALEQADPGYRRRLEGLPKAERRALLEGDWEIFEGQFFEEWRKEKHICEPFKIPQHWDRRGIGVDWGFGAPWAALFFVRDEDAWNGQRIERWYCYRELYGKRITDHEQAKLIAEAMLFDQQQAKEQRLRWAKQADPGMLNRKPGGFEHSVMDTYRSIGRQMKVDLSFSAANNDRINGWQELRGLMADREDGKPGLVFFNTCMNTIRTFPSLIHDKTRVEDLNSDGEDHCLVAGTLVATGRGDVPIEAVQPGDDVLTRNGYRPVLWAGKTRSKAEVMTVTFANRGYLTGTPDHPVWDGENFVRLDALRFGSSPDHMVDIAGDRLRVVGMELAGRSDVYNLTVAEKPEFYANGILVHNCQDATRYWAMGRVGGWIVDIAHQSISITSGQPSGPDIFAVPTIGRTVVGG